MADGGGIAPGPVPAAGPAAGGLPVAAAARAGQRPRSAADLSPPERAAVILAALGPDGAAPILQALGEANLRRFARTIAGLGVIPAPVLDEVVQGFIAELGGVEDVAGGIVTARRMLEHALDREAYARIMEEVQGGQHLAIWDRLGSAPVGSLATFLAGEHPQVGAVILARLRADRAARVLERLPQSIARTIVLRMTRVPRLDPQVLDQVKAVIDEQFLSVIQREQASRKPAELLAGLMNHVSGAARDQFLAELEAEEPAFAAEVQRVMFTFADIAVRVNARDVTAITRAVEEQKLLLALKTGLETHPKVVDFLLGNLSKRLADRLQEDLAAMLPVPLKEGEAAQAEIVKAVQALAQRGEIKLNQPEAGDED